MAAIFENICSFVNPVIRPRHDYRGYLGAYALAKMRRLDLLKSVYGTILIGPQVKAETVDAGKRISASGVEHIEKALGDGWLQMARLSSNEKSMARSIVSKGGLDAGEAESLALASVVRHAD